MALLSQCLKCGKGFGQSAGDYNTTCPDCQLRSRFKVAVSLEISPGVKLVRHCEIHLDIPFGLSLTDIRKQADSLGIASSLARLFGWSFNPSNLVYIIEAIPERQSYSNEIIG
jgi:DNA-directed RNA polymerase subunit RPC12/RpoP